MITTTKKTAHTKKVLNKKTSTGIRLVSQGTNQQQQKKLLLTLEHTKKTTKIKLNFHS